MTVYPQPVFFHFLVHTSHNIAEGEEDASSSTNRQPFTPMVNYTIPVSYKRLEGKNFIS